MKKILVLLFVIGIGILTHYLFFRPFEYEVKFKANTLPGDLIETIRIWNRSLDNAAIVEVDSFTRVRQTIVWKGSSYVYNWHFKTVNDSVTNVNIKISEPDRALLNKVLIPFTSSALEVNTLEISKQFYDVLKVHLDITKVKVIGETVLDSIFCVCRTLNTKQIEKANGMMSDFSILTSFINEFNLEADGPPIVKVTEWNHSLGLLKFDFCFPIVPEDSLPLADSITYKKFAMERTLKAEYFGNYITSDRAWYELVHYAHHNGYEIAGLPIEYFHNNPNLGMNEKEWKAEVFLPIK